MMAENSSIEYVRARSVAVIIKPTVRQIFASGCNANLFALLLGTAAVESNFIFREQKDDGPARGLWQMEPATAVDIYKNYLAYRSGKRRRRQIYQRLMRIKYGPKCRVPYRFFIPRETEEALALRKFDKYACAMARLHYLRVPNPIPYDLEGIARYWKIFYNTAAGKGTPEKFIECWNSLECNQVMKEIYHHGIS
jgi:hypothetical protein